ncbi:MAG: hypothetical protein JWO24_2939 [Rhodospirillales bacterium]|nr:hypothetical protein [Rhodospirillales bacterium]
MRHLAVVAMSVASLTLLAGCEFDTSKEHLVYCQNGGAFGCGHGTRMLLGGGGAVAMGAAMGQFNQNVYQQPAQSNVAMNCTTTTMGQFTNTRCN